MEEIAQLVEACEKRTPTCPMVRDIVKRRIVDTESEISTLTGLQHRMQRALRAWEKLPDGVPDGDTVCHLIESFVDG